MEREREGGRGNGQRGGMERERVGGREGEWRKRRGPCPGDAGYLTACVDV